MTYKARHFERSAAETRNLSQTSRVTEVEEIPQRDDFPSSRPLSYHENDLRSSLYSLHNSA